MADSDPSLRDHLHVLLRLIDRVPGGVRGLHAVADPDLLAVLGQAQLVARMAEAVAVVAAGEVARRSASRDDSSLARRCGERTARHLVAKTAGVGVAQATRMVEVGEATRPRLTLAGEPLPPERQALSAALAAGAVSVGIAELIDRTLTAVGPRLVGGGEAELEVRLLHLAALMSVGEFVRYCKQLPNQVDPEGAAPRDDFLAGKASITETQLPDGMLRVVALLDPERAAYYRAAIRARMTPPSASPPADDAGGGVTPIGDARRVRVQPTPEESRLDAFVAILRDSVKAHDGAQAGIDTTVLVRIDLDALLMKVGTATIDGCAQPISAATARRMAVDAELIPQVLGGRSQLLDQGEGRRLFTKAQRYAILSAYLGCAFPGCQVPSSMVQIHHLGRWATRHRHGRGTTIDNGLPLCGFHNRLMEQGWDVNLHPDGVPWFIPPATVDWARTPVRGGNLVQDLAA